MKWSSDCFGAAVASRERVVTSIAVRDDGTREDFRRSQGHARTSEELHQDCEEPRGKVMAVPIPRSTK